MTQPEVDLLVARICITVLISFALVVAVPTAFSALRKWRAANEARAKAQTGYDLALRVGKLEDRERNEIVTRSGSIAELLALMTQHEARRRKLGISLPTNGEVTADMASGLSNHNNAFQAPAEVWWGLVALAAATAAGIWDVWL